MSRMFSRSRPTHDRGKPLPPIHDITAITHTIARINQRLQMSLDWTGYFDLCAAVSVAIAGAAEPHEARLLDYTGEKSRWVMRWRGRLFVAVYDPSIDRVVTVLLPEHVGAARCW